MRTLLYLVCLLWLVLPGQPVQKARKKPKHTCLEKERYIAQQDTFFKGVFALANDSVFRRVYLHEVKWDTMPFAFSLQYDVHINCQGHVQSYALTGKPCVYMRKDSTFRTSELPDTYSDITKQSDSLVQHVQKWPVYRFKTDSGMISQPYWTHVYHQYRIKKS